MRRRGGSWFRERVNGVVVFYGISGASQRSLDSRKLSPTRVCRVFWRVRKPGFSRPRDNWGAVIGWVRGFLGQFYRVAVTLLGRHTPFSELRNQHHHLEIASRRQLCDEKYLTLGLNAKHFTVTQLDIMNL